MHLFEIALIALAAWAVRAWFWPFAKCAKCAGSGKNRGSTGRRWGQCRRCKGSGSRQVLGSRRLHAAVRSVRSASGKTRGR